MFKPCLANSRKSSPNTDPQQNGQNEACENPMDDFTLYLSDVSSISIFIGHLELYLAILYFI